MVRGSHKVNFSGKASKCERNNLEKEEEVQDSKLDLSTPVKAVSGNRRRPLKTLTQTESSNLETPEKSKAVALKTAFDDSPAESCLSTTKSKVVVEDRVAHAYKIIQKRTGSLGGNGYNGAIYGEITMISMQRIVDILIKHCGLSDASRFIDVGAGLGKPNFHVAQYPAVRLSIGVELEEIRWQVRVNMSLSSWCGLIASICSYRCTTYCACVKRFPLSLPLHPMSRIVSHVRKASNLVCLFTEELTSSSATSTKPLVWCAAL